MLLLMMIVIKVVTMFRASFGKICRITGVKINFCWKLSLKCSKTCI